MSLGEMKIRENIAKRVALGTQMGEDGKRFRYCGCGSTVKEDMQHCKGCGTRYTLTIVKEG